MTQGDPVSPTVFNIVVDAVVRGVMLEVCVPQEDKHGLGWATGEHTIVLYANKVRITGRNTIWIWTMLTAVVRIFERVGR